MLGALSVPLHAVPPSINTQPRSQTDILYQPASFSVVAAGTAPLSYQWRRGGVPIAGATNVQILLAQTQFSDAGKYSVVISNGEGSTTSIEAALRVDALDAGDPDYSFTRIIPSDYPVASGSSTDAEVRAIMVQPDGKVVMAGSFPATRGAFRGHIARLNSDGTLDRTFMEGLSGANGPIHSLALQGDGKILIGGSFRSVNDVPRSFIARLNADGTVDESFQYRKGPGDYISAVMIAVQGDGKVLVGDRNGRPVPGIVYPEWQYAGLLRLTPDGAVDSTFQDSFQVINGVSDVDHPFLNSVALQPDGKMLAGGRFDTVNGESRNGIARLNADGSLDTSFQSGLAAGTVQSISLQERRQDPRRSRVHRAGRLGTPGHYPAQSERKHGPELPEPK